jgi:hypothetical protein
MQINYKAVRAFHRATRELEDQFAIALEADHAVCPDGYGTASIETRYEGHRHDIAHRVGRRFGITANELLDQEMESQWNFDTHFFNRKKRDKFYIVADTEDGLCRYAGGGCWDYGSPHTMLFSTREAAEEKIAEIKTTVNRGIFFNIRVYSPIKA